MDELRAFWTMAAAAVLLLLASCDLTPGSTAASGRAAAQKPDQEATAMPDKVVKTDAEWKQLLTPEQYRILRKKGTEPAFTGQYYDLKEKGVYECAACGNVLFSSDAKYDSGTGWPSFWKPATEGSVTTQPDNTLFTRRTEVLCSRCGGHLGHVFDDGPPPTGLRYCINSAALKFVPAAQDDQAGGTGK
jgi:peptide-methionine (R)-S-oxide reductase